MSFEQPADQATPNATDQLTFNVGERSFNAESATTKIENADAHIAKLEAENAEYKSRIDQSTSIDDALAQLRVKEQPAEPQNSQATEPTSSVSEEQIGAIANKQIADYLATKQVEDNASAAKTLAETTYKDTGDKLKVIYGDKTDEAMATKAAELGITTQALFDMAKSPATAQMLLQSMKVNSAPPQSSPASGFNTGSHTDPSEQFINYADGKVTSSTILNALNKAGGKY